MINYKVKQIASKAIRKIRKPKVRFEQFPRRAIIDPIDRCNLNCPLCMGRLRKPMGMMSMGTFKKVMSEIPFVREVVLFNWGEPFLNPNIFKMIRYMKGRNMRVVVHSNLNVGSVERIAESGIDELTVSCDAATRESYEKYRIGGDFGKVFRKMCYLSSRMNVVWQFIVNKHNEHEIGEAKKLAKKFNLNLNIISLGYYTPDADCWNLSNKWRNFLPKNKKHIQDQSATPIYGGMCPFLFGIPTINPDGTVSPCCFVIDTLFGDLKTNTFEEIWNNEKFRYSRSLFTGDTHKKVKTVCSTCRAYRKVKT